MMICGIKITHDAGVAVIEDNQLLFSVEVEKLGNNPRYSSMPDLGQVAEILRAEGVKPSEVDQFVVDGWFVEGVDDTDVRDPAVMWARGGEPAAYLGGALPGSSRRHRPACPLSVPRLRVRAISGRLCRLPPCRQPSAGRLLLKPVRHAR